jgi:ribosome maturation protein Sdo1
MSGSVGQRGVCGTAENLEDVLKILEVFKEVRRGEDVDV